MTEMDLLKFAADNPSVPTILIITPIIIRSLSFIFTGITSEIRDFKTTVTNEMHLLNVKLAEVLVQIQFHSKYIDQHAKRLDKLEDRQKDF